MSIYKSAVNRPVTTIMLFTAIIVMGIYSMVQLPIDFYPEIEPPFISVMTTYPGANASDIETNITRTLEDAFNAIDNLKEITSTSYDNLSVIFIEFEWGANLDEATNDLRSAIDMVFDALPDDCDRPSVFKFNTAMMPILFYAITAEESYPGLERLIDEKIINPLNRIEGIGSIAMAGAPRRTVYVDIDPQRLDAYNLTIEQIGSVIAAENLNMPSGKVKMGELEYQLRIQGEFSESYQIQNIVIGNYSGKTVYLKDIGTVRDTIKDLSIEERINGQQGLRMFVMKQSGANTVKIVRQVTNQLEDLVNTLPPDIKIEPIFDTSSFIKDAIRNLSKAIMWALIFVVLVVLFFLGRWRATFIVALAIPVSLITSFIYLNFTGNSINIISLASLSIAIGMVVDDAIVVLENISRHIDRGSSPREASIYATNEVWLAVIVTTLVIVAVFLPLTMVSGLTGVMFKQLGWIVTITVVTSTVTAISLTPMLTSKLLKLKVTGEKKKNSLYDSTFGVFLNWLDGFYVKTLSWALRHKGFVITASMILFFSSFFLLKFVGTDFMPESDESQLNAAIELQPGIRVEETIRTTRKLEQLINERYPEVDLISTSTGADDEGGFISMFSQSGSNIINLSMRLIPVSDRERTVWEISDDLREQLDQIPEIIDYNVNMSTMFMGGNTVDVEIYGYDFDKTSRLAQEILNTVKNIDGAVDVQVSREKEKPELQIVLDKEKLSEHGLNTAMVSLYIRNRVEGLIASRFREEGDEYNIVVRLKEEYRNSITDLEEITIMTPMGKKIKIGELGDVKEYWSPPNIQRKRKERIVTVSATPSGISLGELATKIRSEIGSVDIPPDLMVVVGGAYEDQMESFLDLAMLMVLSLVLVYLVMASQFESFRIPLVIMFAVPFSFTGVIIALFITNTTLSVIAGLGAVLLIGIVVKNGIVLVDYINLMRDRDYEMFEAITLSGRSRLRPVLMTAFTTILGMLPLALSRGEGSEVWSPMGITVIGGLVFSTFLTLVIVPVIYYAFMGKVKRGRFKYNRNGLFVIGKNKGSSKVE
ncbi:MAG: multidrug transporter AcrB [Bacteroides sp. SM23_62_1]|nr:MAG: multidrug transporter AcrB [Bacteroides sp. SM23_62_1]